MKEKKIKQKIKEGNNIILREKGSCEHLQIGDLVLESTIWDLNDMSILVIKLLKDSTIKEYLKAWNNQKVLSGGMVG